MRGFTMLSGIFDVYNSPSNTDYGLYAELGEKTLDLGVGTYNIILVAAVYLSGIAFVVSGIMLIVNSRSSSQKISESKKLISRVFIISTLIFSVTGLIMLVQAMAIH